MLSGRRRLLPDFFRQRFAQVTNPPIDPLREQSVMSLRTLIGKRGRLLDDGAVHARMVACESPILTDAQLAGLHGLIERVDDLGLELVSVNPCSEPRRPHEHPHA